jgi:alanyl-tRNA synthetase
MESRRRKRARAWAGSGEAATESDLVRMREKLRRDRIPRLRHRKAEGVVLALVKDGKEGDSRRRPAMRVAVVVNQTPFYGESGGQVGDTGVMTGEGFSIHRHRHAEEGRRPFRPSAAR